MKVSPEITAKGPSYMYVNQERTSLGKSIVRYWNKRNDYTYPIMKINGISRYLDIPRPNSTYLDTNKVYLHPYTTTIAAKIKTDAAMIRARGMVKKIRCFIGWTTRKYQSTDIRAMVCREAATVVMTTKPWNWHTTEHAVHLPVMIASEDGGVARKIMAISERASEAMNSPGTFRSLADW